MFFSLFDRSIVLLSFVYFIPIFVMFLVHSFANIAHSLLLLYPRVVCCLFIYSIDLSFVCSVLFSICVFIRSYVEFPFILSFSVCSYQARSQNFRWEGPEFWSQQTKGVLGYHPAFFLIHSCYLVYFITSVTQKSFI